MFRTQLFASTLALGVLASAARAELDVPAATAIVAASPEAKLGDGDGQGDATVAGTDFQATARIPCRGVGSAAGTCQAGVTRGPDQIAVEVSLPSGRTRSLLFDGKGKFITIASSQADGTAAWKVSSRRDGDTTVIQAGPETYRVPDAFVVGD
ncbi:hypothetical protein G7076_10315 [Sphingomonas sp. HDW15A]|uniref:hypothetical protein n=1 Tax=Sphingomonas sp. HDW15A TaxID=2714942 RepID=UPI00140A8A33|nr:hypothetical protein [Sphingomonas sp. HDW15A]QIK96774.1 hypothetical protein G7076_10315 [Sphingomonas sp. HDW15A]